ncbi:hypothetical protein MmiHf6_06430 [Methanimicrococcus hongohii]|uniref:Acid-resistance membrane protein n=1 Tax=Methanimicrococcus hongohii TaxID=3028295 RepID=A0AA96UZ38_9EURY|nr:DUF308 domain-containing protein [Methanimicrococcus sp. Hf6]WNY23337.1 hypothetical protein MmiHf6_06430 [Methanimicrococcus sp. Hf6]
MDYAVKTKKFDWFSFLIGILFILISLFVFSHIRGSLAAVALYIGLLAILAGIIEFISWYQLRKVGIGSALFFVLGILDILIGLFIIINLNVSIIALPYVFSIWFIISSILGLLTLDLAKMIGKVYYWFKIIISVLGIVIGIALLFNPVISAFMLSFLVGLYFLIYGVVYIVKAF